MLKKTSLTIQEANWLFAFLVLGWGGVIGSGISVLVIGALVWNLGALALGRLSIDVEPEARLTAALFAAFFAAMAVSDLINYAPADAGKEMAKNLPFLGIILLYASLTRSTRESIAHASRNGAVFGAYATFGLAIIQYAVLDNPRPEGFAGNPGPLAVVAGFLYCTCLVTVAERSGRERLLALGAAGCAATVLLLAGMRGLWPILLVGPVIPLTIYGRSILAGHAGKFFVIGGVFLVALAAIAYPTVSDRVALIGHDYREITGDGDFNNSLGHRLVMWETGIDLIRERPVLGHGSADIRNLMQERAQALGHIAVSHSHFHNFLINTAVRAGILGLLALLAMMIVPVWLASRKQGRDGTANFGFGMMLSLYATFTISGMTNIMLHHDIMDSLFVFGTAASCFLVFRRQDVPSA